MVALSPLVAVADPGASSLSRLAADSEVMRSNCADVAFEVGVPLLPVRSLPGRAGKTNSLCMRADGGKSCSRALREMRMLPPGPAARRSRGEDDVRDALDEVALGAAPPLPAASRTGEVQGA